MTVAARAAYKQTSLETAPKGRVLVQLYERLERDLVSAMFAIDERDHEGVHDHLIHAQDVIAGLSAALDVSIWPDGVYLRKIYDFLLHELPLANMEKSKVKIHGCLGVVRELTGAWREALLVSAGPLTITDRA